LLVGPGALVTPENDKTEAERQLFVFMGDPIEPQKEEEKEKEEEYRI